MNAILSLTADEILVLDHVFPASSAQDIPDRSLVHPEYSRQVSLFGRHGEHANLAHVLIRQFCVVVIDAPSKFLRVCLRAVITSTGHPLRMICRAGSSLPNHVLHIVFVCPCEQVARTAARRVVAFVAGIQVWCKWLNLSFINHSRHDVSLSFVSNLAISPRRERAGEYPAPSKIRTNERAILIDLRPKSLCERRYFSAVEITRPRAEARRAVCVKGSLTMNTLVRTRAGAVWDWRRLREHRDLQRPGDTPGALISPPGIRYCGGTILP